MELADFNRVILASASPRRKELLGKLFDEFEIMTSDAEEGGDGDVSLEPHAVAEKMALAKAEDVASRAVGESDGRTLVIGADTIVVLGKEILGKPVDEKDAVDMLKRLGAAGEHLVYTGVAIIIAENGKRDIINFSEMTRVEFYPVTDSEAGWYVSSGEPMDKAGAYGIQGLGGRFVKGISGDYNNVVGLPVAGIYRAIKKYK